MIKLSKKVNGLHINFVPNFSKVAAEYVKTKSLDEK